MKDGSDNQILVQADDPITQFRQLNWESSTCDGSKVIQVNSMELLLIDWPHCPIGTLAFILDEEVPMVKVTSGWRYVVVRSSVVSFHFRCPSGSPSAIGFILLQLGNLVSLPEGVA